MARRGGRTENTPVFPSISRVSYSYGLILGAVSFFTGYIITLVIKSGGEISKLSPISDLAPAVWQGAGWVYFAMHNVPINVSLSGAVPIGETHDPAPASSLVSGLLIALPLVILAASGYLVARKTDVNTLKRGVTAGVVPVLGYLPMSAVFAYLFTWSYDGRSYRGSYAVEAGPDMATAIVIAGIVYPVVIGGIGGALAGVMGKDSRATRNYAENTGPQRERNQYQWYDEDNSTNELDAKFVTQIIKNDTHTAPSAIEITYDSDTPLRPENVRVLGDFGERSWESLVDGRAPDRLRKSASVTISEDDTNVENIDNLTFKIVHSRDASDSIVLHKHRQTSEEGKKGGR